MILISVTHHSLEYQSISLQSSSNPCSHQTSFSDLLAHRFFTIRSEVWSTSCQHLISTTSLFEPLRAQHHKLTLGGGHAASYVQACCKLKQKKRSSQTIASTGMKISHEFASQYPASWLNQNRYIWVEITRIVNWRMSKRSLNCPCLPVTFHYCSVPARCTILIFKKNFIISKKVQPYREP